MQRLEHVRARQLFGQRGAEQAGGPQHRRAVDQRQRRALVSLAEDFVVLGLHDMIDVRREHRAAAPFAHETHDRVDAPAGGSSTSSCERATDRLDRADQALESCSREAESTDPARLAPLDGGLGDLRHGVVRGYSAP